MAEKWLAERRRVMLVAKELERLGLVAGSSGNVSARVQERGRPLLVITPTSRSYSSLRVRDVVVIDYEGEPMRGTLPPSSETMLHVAVYQARRDVGAVIHTHSIYASACAVAGLEVPPLLDEMVVYLGGGIKVAEYGFPGTTELGAKACAALGDRKAVLLRNHGMVGVGATLEEAMGVCRLVERAAHIFVMASLLGSPTPLPADVVEKERALYGMRLRAEGGPS
ncbi:MAG: class II aldolase/adducin family protein [Dehalococcoidia bacterium]|nr:class II aldolase/adducin family protein [Dehalococcoidia bacterium]